jgi:hypothetical protein
LLRPTTKLPLAVAVLGLLTFAPVVGFAFAYDDFWTLVENRWLERPLGELVRLLASGRAVAQHVPDATRPLMVLGHWFERRLFGLEPWGYHLDSLLLYAVACALATRLAWLVSRKRSVVLFAGVFFALAPLHAEPVAAVNYREDLYAAIGMLAALITLLTPHVVSDGRGPDSGRRALGAAAWLLFALLGKESALAFVPLAGLIVWCDPRAFVIVRARRRVLYALGGVLVLWLLWRVPLALHGDDLPLAPSRPISQTLLRTARFEVMAVRHALFPWSYSPDHWHQPDASAAWVAPCLSLMAGVLLLGRSAATRLPALGVGIALAAPLACCPLLRPVNEYADRYFFLSVLGGGLVWAWAAERVAVRFAWGGRALLLVACAALLVPTWRATELWRNERSLWTATVALTPGSARAWVGLSIVHRKAHEQEPADRALERGLAVDPEYGVGLVSQVYNDLAFGRLAQARERLAELERRDLRKLPGLGKAQRCAELDAAAAARCIDN